jgi:hypothetical protein
MLTRTAGVELAKRDISSSGSVRAVATPINLSTMDASAKLARFIGGLTLTNRPPGAAARLTSGYGS